LQKNALRVILFHMEEVITFQLQHVLDPFAKNVGLHSHDFYELYFFIEGEVGYFVEDRRYKLKKGDILLISSDCLHRMEGYSSSKQYNRMVLWLSEKFVASLSNQKTNLADCFLLCGEDKSFLIRNEAISERVRKILCTLEECIKNNEYGKELEEKNLIQSLLLLLCRHVIDRRTETKEDLSKKINKSIENLIAYIDDNLDKNLSLDELEKVALVSKFYLSRLFKEETNTTLHKYIVKKRLLLAKKYLEQGMNIGDICSMCGFADQSTFFRLFKQEYRLTPHLYKKISGNK